MRGVVGWAYSPAGRDVAATLSRSTGARDAALAGFHTNRTRAWCFAAFISSAFLLLLMCVPASAKPSQSDVFKSIQDSVSNSDETNTNFVPWVCGGVGLIILLALFSKRQSRQNVPKVVNHSGRLLKEVLKKISLRPKELKQLKTLADETELPGGQPVNPLVLLLAPSIMIKSVNERTTRADRRTLVQVLKKLGIR
jgi:hypothetical protein